MNMFGSVCEKRNLKINVSKSKVMVFERNEDTKCEVRLNGLLIENVSSLKYLGSVMNKDGSL